MSSTAGRVGTTCVKVRVTHPFHPHCGREFDLICRRRHWGEDRVVYEGTDGRLCTIASAWTKSTLWPVQMLWGGRRR